MNRKLLAAYFVFVLAAMLWVTVTATLERSVLEAVSDIWSDPWGKATLFDAYFAFLTIYVWIYLRETRAWTRLLWLVLLLTLGNFAIAAYGLRVLLRREPLWPQEHRAPSG